MTVMSRLRTLFRVKANKALDRAEDPREMLDDSYEQQLNMLQQVRRGLAEVATAKKRIELQGQDMGVRYQRLADQAKEAMQQGREDLARTALERRAQLEGQVTALRQQHTALQQQQDRLEANEQRLAERVAAFRTEKETIKATYTASEAQAKANEAVAGIGSEMNDVGRTLDRARDRVSQMQARAAATDDLLASGALQDLTAAPDADLEHQLAAGASSADIERQLAAMRTGTGKEDPSAASSSTPVGADWLQIGQPTNSATSPANPTDEVR